MRTILENKLFLKTETTIKGPLTEKPQTKISASIQRKKRKCEIINLFSSLQVQHAAHSPATGGH